MAQEALTRGVQDDVQVLGAYEEGLCDDLTRYLANDTTVEGK